MESAAFDPSLSWKTIDTPHFSIHYPEDLVVLVPRTMEHLEEAYGILNKKYQWQPFGKIQVVLTDFTDDANGTATVIPYNWLFLRAVAPGPETGISFYDEWQKLLIYHELTHIMHLDAARGFWRPWRVLFGKTASPAGFTPGWIREGTATLEETLYTKGGRGRSTYTEMLLRTAILQDQFLSIDRAEGFQWSWPSSQAAYHYGVAFLDYLVKTYGEEKFMAFHRRTQGSPMLGALNRHAKKTIGKQERHPSCEERNHRDDRFSNQERFKNKITVCPEVLPRDKTLYQLWDEWEASLRMKYNKEADALRKEGVSHLSVVLKEDDFVGLPTFSPDGKQVAYTTASYKQSSGIWVMNLETGKKRRVAKRSAGQLAFSSDGKKLYFSMMVGYHWYYRFYDLYELNLETKKSKRLTRGKRIRDFSVHPNGEEVLVVSVSPKGDQLQRYHLEKKEFHDWVKGGVYEQFAHPRFSPDGKKVAVSRFVPGVGWELYLYDYKMQSPARITRNGLAMDLRPVWSSDGRFIYFSSDVSGISNIYRWALVSKQMVRMTNVLTGVGQPAVSNDGQKLWMRYYNGNGYEIREMPLEGENGVVAQQTSVSKETPVVFKKSIDSLSGAQSYSPFRAPLFVPRYLVPSYLVSDDSFLFSLITGATDPLMRHSWMGGATYRTDATKLGYFADYAYRRFRPSFGLGWTTSYVDYGSNAFEKREGINTYISYPWSGQALSLSYLYQKRTALFTGTANNGNFAGTTLSYRYGETSEYPASISHPEKGRKILVSGTVYDRMMGADERNEKQIAYADWREFVPLGGRHVFALRATGGYSWGDRVIPRVFTLGGSLGEGMLVGPASSRYFPLRGLLTPHFSGDRAALASGEYRLPLASPQRGLGTWPFFVNDVHMAFFGDYGNIWNTRFSFDDFLLGVGSELRGDFIIGHGLPLTGRLGYAVIVLNRDAVRGLDSLTGRSLKDGVLIMQWGMSF